MPRPTTHNRGTRRSEAESDLGEVLAMADPDLASYVEKNEGLRLRNEALLKRVAKLERALDEAVAIVGGGRDQFSALNQKAREWRELL
jgi:hypothetical protein